MRSSGTWKEHSSWWWKTWLEVPALLISTYEVMNTCFLIFKNRDFLFSFSSLLLNLPHVIECEMCVILKDLVEKPSITFAIII